MAGFQQRDDLLHDVDELVVGRREHARDALRLERREVVARDDATEDHHHVVGRARLAQPVHELVGQLEVAAAQHRRADHVGVLLHGALHDLLRREADARVDDVEAHVARRHGDDFGAVAVAVEAGLAHHHAGPVPEHLHEIRDAPAQRVHARAFQREPLAFDAGGRAVLAEHLAQGVGPLTRGHTRERTLDGRLHHGLAALGRRLERRQRRRHTGTVTLALGLG